MDDNGSAPTPATLPNLAGHKIRELERQAIHDTIVVTGGNITRTAHLLGMTSRTLQRRIARCPELLDHVFAVRASHAEQKWQAHQEAS